MSRCFPFPPPGYEKKHIPEDAGILKEEKKKEKKHKKDKKDKKREGKEKKEKDRSDRKHRDKERKDKRKDKKEKRRDKKDKEKEQGKDKERSSISEEAKLAEQNIGIYSEDKKYVALCQVEHVQKRVQTNIPDEEAVESKFLQELGRRIKDDEKGKGNRLNEAKEKNKEMGAQATIRNGSVSSGSAMVSNNNKVEGMPRLLEENNERKGEKEQPKVGNEKLGHKKERGKTSGVDGKLRHTNKDNGGDREKEKEKVKNTALEGNIISKMKDVERNGFLHSEFFSAKNNDAALGGNIISKRKDVERNGFLHSEFFSAKKSDAALEGNIISKRKDVERNGFLHKSETRPAKLPRHNLHEMTGNGSKVETLQIPNILTSADLKPVNTVHRINGTIQSQLLLGSVPKPSPIVTGESSMRPPRPDDTSKASKELHRPNKKDKTSKKRPQPDEIAKASKKTPHPDLKYLGQIHSVPKMEEWNEFDDQEWLFGSNDSSRRKRCKDIPDAEQLVWSEARCISADFVALPYVIPY